MGFMARVVPLDVGVPQLAFLGGHDLLGPIDCPCGRQIDVIWMDL